MKTADTKKEAEGLLKSFQEDTRNLGYCPLIVGICQKDCVCYSKPRMVPFTSGGKYNVYDGYCGNVMFFGSE